MGYTASHIKTDRIDKMWTKAGIRTNYAERFYRELRYYGMKMEVYDRIPRSNVFKYFNAKQEECLIYYTGGYDWWAFSESTVKKMDKKYCLVIQAYSFDDPKCHFWIPKKPLKYDDRGRITFQDRGGFYASPRVNNPQYDYSLYKCDNVQVLIDVLMKENCHV